MEKHKCKLCSRTFSNGRALGGHMKAHLATLPLPPPPPPYPSSSFSSSSSSSSESEKQSNRETEHNNKTLIYALRENPKKSFKLASETETESMNIMMMTTTRQRSKRNRSYFITPNLSFVADPPEPVLSSVSDGSTEEHVALCLMMLSRDTWQQKKKQEYEEDDDEIKKVKKKKNQCEGCGKSFRSSRALGSHRSICCRGEPGTGGGGGERVFECPFCLKVFGSGQALGGHKRSHLMGISATDHSTSIVSDSVMIMKNSNSRERFIDLNLPAPVEDDGELSVVSDVSDA